MRRILPFLIATLLAGAASSQMNTTTTRTTDGARNEILVRDTLGRQQTLRLDNATRFERPGVTGAPATVIRGDDLVIGDRILATDPAQRGGFTPRIQVLPPGAVSAPGS